MIIRRAETEDADFMSMVDLECFSVPWSSDAFRREIVHNRIAFYVVAEHEEKIVGYYGILEDRKRGPHNKCCGAS